MTTHRLEAVISGRVQGVGFRYFVAREADALGLAGEVWNRADGAVEVRAVGARDRLATLAKRLASGPSGAHVTGVALQWGTGNATRPGFRIVSSRMT